MCRPYVLFALRRGGRFLQADVTAVFADQRADQRGGTPVVEEDVLSTLEGAENLGVEPLERTGVDEFNVVSESIPDDLLLVPYLTFPSGDTGNQRSLVSRSRTA